MASQLAHNMLKVNISFSIVSTGRGDVLAPDNPSQERDIWKGEGQIYGDEVR